MTLHYICCDDCKVRMYAGIGYSVPSVTHVESDEDSDPLAMFVHEHTGHRLCWTHDGLLDNDIERDEYPRIEWSDADFAFKERGGQ